MRALSDMDPLEFVGQLLLPIPLASPERDNTADICGLPEVIAAAHMLLK